MRDIITKRINFSQARAQLRTLVDEVKRSGRPVTILRRGEPEAVLISYEQFQQKFGKGKKRPWRLSGSLRVRRGVNIDKAIAEVRQSMRQALENRLQRYVRDLAEP